MTNRKFNLIENLVIWFLCGLMIVATIVLKRAEINDDEYQLDDWTPIMPSVKIHNEPDENHKKGVYRL